MKYNGKEYYSQGDVYNAIEIENKELRGENRKLKEEKKAERNICWTIFKVLFCVLCAELLILFLIKQPPLAITILGIGGLSWVLYTIFND